MANILIIDDEESVRDSCSYVLIKEKYNVETAGDGETGLNKLREIKADLALVDLKMPGLGGIEVLKKIRDIDPDIITIVITGFATIDSAVDSMKEGAYDFLPKPFTPDELRFIVRRGLEKRKLALEAAALREEKKRIEENFITLVTHELRTPLADIQQYFEVILGGITGEVEVRQRKILEKVRERIDTLLKLINDWLDITLIKAGEFVGNFELVDITSILTEVISYMQPQAELKKITLKIDSSLSLGEVMGDKKSLKMMFTNLVSNGIKFNHEGGSVLVKVNKQEDDITIVISDTGIGILKEDLPFIFDEFFRVKSDKTRHIIGTGLGLSIVKKIIEMHSASIKVESELGKGSTFYINLPKLKKESIL
ncbi:MAG: response regulator [Actinobacteria bacterium]|nr:response regulator [Actinomycetota bacterium]